MAFITSAQSGIHRSQTSEELSSKTKKYKAIQSRRRAPPPELLHTNQVIVTQDTTTAGPKKQSGDNNKARESLRDYPEN